MAYWDEVIQKYRTADQERSTSSNVALMTEEAGDLLMEKAEYWSKMKEAKDSDDQVLVNLWNEVMQKYTEAANYKIRAAHALKKGDEEEAICWGGGNALRRGEEYAPCAMTYAARCLVERVKVFSKIKELQSMGSQEEINTWINIDQKYQLCAEEYTKAAKAFSEGKWDLGREHRDLARNNGIRYLDKINFDQINIPETQK